MDSPRRPIKDQYILVAQIHGLNYYVQYINHKGFRLNGLIQNAAIFTNKEAAENWQKEYKHAFEIVQK